jgi:hypothetical protein
MRAGNAGTSLAGSSREQAILGVDAVLRLIAAGNHRKRNGRKNGEMNFA